jgi:hypothetical protein
MAEVPVAPTPPAEPVEAPRAAAPRAPEVPEDIGDCFVFVDADPDYGEAPLETKFTVELDCGNKPVTLTWQFGDGATAGNEPSPTHRYERPGDYIVVVTATTDDGQRGSDEIDILVEEAEG